MTLDSKYDMIMTVGKQVVRRNQPWFRTSLIDGDCSSGFIIHRHYSLDNMTTKSLTLDILGLQVRVRVHETPKDLKHKSKFSIR